MHASRTRLGLFSNGASTPSRYVLCTRSTRRSPAGSTARAFSPVVSAGERPQVKVVWRRAHLCSVACRGRCVRAPPCPVPVIFFSRVRHRAVRAVTFGRYLRLQKPVRFFFFFPFVNPALIPFSCLSWCFPPALSLWTIEWPSADSDACSVFAGRCPRFLGRKGRASRYSRHRRLTGACRMSGSTNFSEERLRCAQRSASPAGNCSERCVLV